MVIMGFDFLVTKRQKCNSASSPSKAKAKNVKCIWRSSGSIFERVLLERETSL